MNYFYYLDEKTHCIFRSEIQDIERSGRSVTVQEYATGAPTQWNDNGWAALHALIAENTPKTPRQ